MLLLSLLLLLQLRRPQGPVLFWGYPGQQAHLGRPQLPLPMQRSSTGYHRHQHHQQGGSECHGPGQQRQQGQQELGGVLVVLLHLHCACGAVPGTSHAAGQHCVPVPLRWVSLKGCGGGRRGGARDPNPWRCLMWRGWVPGTGHAAGQHSIPVPIKCLLLVLQAKNTTHSLLCAAAVSLLLLLLLLQWHTSRCSRPSPLWSQCSLRSCSAWSAPHCCWCQQWA